MKELILLRGLPGSGKSTFAELLSGFRCEADDFFMVDGEYKFDGSKLGKAHAQCQFMCESFMVREKPKVVVSNTFTQQWEMDSYYDLAKKYGYKVTSIICENRHDGVNTHGVPADKLEQMKNRFEVKL